MQIFVEIETGRADFRLTVTGASCINESLGRAGKVYFAVVVSPFSYVSQDL